MLVVRLQQPDEGHHIYIRIIECGVDPLSQVFCHPLLFGKLEGAAFGRVYYVCRNHVGRGSKVSAAFILQLIKDWANFDESF
jgi:hypothetical protein